MDRVHRNIDFVHGLPFMDRENGPPMFTTAKITKVNNNKIKIIKKKLIEKKLIHIVISNNH